MKRVVKKALKIGKKIDKSIKNAKSSLKERVDNLMDFNIEMEEQDSEIAMVSRMIQFNGYVPVNSFQIFN